jgi:hypothetical protein
MDLINHKVFFPDGSCQVDNFFTYIAFIPKICMYYLKHVEQQCFIRYKDTSRSGVSLGLIKHVVRMFLKKIASETIDLVSSLAK